MELQRDLETFSREGIKVFAISYDSQDTLREFAERQDIAYPLLSDEDSRVIREFGILNTNIPHSSERFGVPYPGSYMVGNDGRVFEKSFIAEHVTRDSVRDLLQEGFRIDGPDAKHAATVRSPDLAARAFFSSPTLRPRQLTVLTVDIALADGLHVYGRPVSDEYAPVELSIAEGEHLAIDRVEYPAPEEMELEALDERLPVYTGDFAIKAHCMGTGKPDGKPLVVKAQLRYQACDDRQCYLPQTDEFELSLEYLPHVR